MTKAKELYRAYRPRKLSDVIGQSDACNILRSHLENESVPQAILFSGPSGSGKTTLARIMCRELKCGKFDFTEQNCANVRGIDDIRVIKDRVGYMPVAGKCRIVLLDECAELSKPAMSALLKMLEDPPDHAYYFLATTDPGKLLPTIRTRCTQIITKPLTQKQLKEVITTTCSRAKVPAPSEDVMDRVVECSDGSARTAVKLWDQVRNLQTEEAQLDGIQNSEARNSGFAIAQAIIQKKRWIDIAALIKTVDDEPETIRRIIIGYASTMMLNGRDLERCLAIITILGRNFYDTGKAGLVAGVYECCTTK